MDDLENNHIENIWVEVQSLKNKFLLGHFYGPPNATTEYWDNLEDVIENTSEENLDIIIMGDFNHNTLKANIHSPLLRTLTKFSLQNLITEPTRVTNVSSTCIDLIITNHHAIITGTNVLPPFSSDHCTITAEITFKTYESLAYQTLIWKYEEADFQSIKAKVDSVDWSFISNEDNIYIINEKFSDILTETAEQFIPKVSFIIRPNDKPWMSTLIRKNMRQRDRLYHKAKNKNTEFHLSNYKNKRNQVVHMVRDAKRNLICLNFKINLLTITCHPKAGIKLQIV